MKKISKLYPYPADYIIFAFFLALSALFFFLKFKPSEPALYAVVETAYGERHVLSMSTDTVLSVKGDIGMTIIEIKSGKARILSSPCRNKICEKRGWIKRTWESSACLPNGVWLSISGQKPDIDAITY